MASGKNGDALKAIGEAATRVDAVYSTPFLAHACMEVMNCTVKLSADKADAWVPTQNLEASLAALSEASGIPLDKCEIHRHDLGGGFGRRGGTQDYVHQAVEIAKQFPDVPVKLIWSREEDQAHDFYRPISQCKLSAGLDSAGNLTACMFGSRASRSMPCSIRKASSTARICASCRVTPPRPATRSLATACPIC